MDSIILIVISGFILDLMLGDPHNFPHPVRLIGNIISRGEKHIRSILP
ncbi:MAG: cobalamin biosynthesis protein, partial [Zhenhengia sp.]